MKYGKIIALLAALSLTGSALSEPVDTEYLVDMTSEQVIRLEQRLSELAFSAPTAIPPTMPKPVPPWRASSRPTGWRSTAWRTAPRWSA